MFFSLEGKSIISSKGEKTVIICASNSNTKGASVAVMITANGDKLSLLIAFKGTPNVKIARNDFLHMDSTAFYLCQKMH